eukprot:NODE_7364_length_445_cov_244.015385.p2 GENE.NODE_7364_length_445_cov_244.015385~~NODE_7364_length_445_cov_244.015385.p2  ORF type:complete len:113 (-),score=34.60 NODE_7364_length_445_cov_244.015385:88-399(-)
MLASHLVDWLVATRGCVRLGGAGVAEELTRHDAWPRWARVWGRARLRRMGPVVVSAVRQVLAPASTTEVPLTGRAPSECAVRRAAELLCGIDAREAAGAFDTE